LENGNKRSVEKVIAEDFVALTMSETLFKNPPRTLLEVWESLPEGTLCQVINNTLVMSPAPLDNHQKILIKLSSKIYFFVEENNLGQVRVAPYDVHFDEENIFQPDIVFVARENTHLIRERGLYGAPDIVLEILSPGNKGYDKKDKKQVYEKYGVKEYWIIEPNDKTVTGFTLVNDKFVQSSLAKGVIESKLLGSTFTF
jgi:Uma2 family endonuclease